MSIELAGAGTLIVIIIMALVTLATRWGGLYIMHYIPIKKRTRQFIEAMSGSVLVALITPMAVTGDTGARIALLTTAVMILLLKKPLPAIACGIIAAAVARQF